MGLSLRKLTRALAGNLRENSLSSRVTLRYTHDAWNRLVKVEHLNSSTTPTVVTVRGEYEYNGLGQRVVKRSDHNITDSTAGLDEQRLLYYSAGWQVLEERVDDNWSSGHTTDRIVQHVWGLRYIDDLVLTRQDTDANGSYENKFDFTHYALTDHQFSVVAVIADSGALLNRVGYTPYGEARHQWFNDVNGDGAVNAADTTAASTANGYHIYEVGTNQHYNVDADFNRDGVVDSNDTALVTSADYRAALPGGWIASAGSAHTNGYCGYVFNQESSFYTVRFRHYDPQWGRWISRDPAGYMDSMSLYGYGTGSPIWESDPFGLMAWYDRWLENAANFAAGVSDSLTIGATDYIREWWGINDVVDHESGAYVAGELTEIAVEIAVSGGGATLRHAAKGASKKAVRDAVKRETRHIARDGKKLHHKNPLFGHPGGSATTFPLGGLPAWIHSGGWNLKLLTHAQHVRAHRILRRIEQIFGFAFNRWFFLLRILRMMDQGAGEDVIASRGSLRDPTGPPIKAGGAQDCAAPTAGSGAALPARNSPFCRQETR